MGCPIQGAQAWTDTLTGFHQKMRCGIHGLKIKVYTLFQHRPNGVVCIIELKPSPHDTTTPTYIIIHSSYSPPTPIPSHTQPTTQPPPYNPPVLQHSSPSPSLSSSKPWSPYLLPSLKPCSHSPRAPRNFVAALSSARLLYALTCCIRVLLGRCLPSHC